MIENSPEPLDQTIIHPDDYDFFYSKIPREIFKNASQLKDIVKKLDKTSFNGKEYIYDFLNNPPNITLTESYEQLSRTDIPCYSHPGILLKGKVQSITDFGAFIDVNLCESAFLYKDKMTNEILKEKGYGDELKIGEYVNVVVTYKEYKDLVFVDPDLTSYKFNGKYHEFLRCYKKSHSFESIEYNIII